MHTAAVNPQSTYGLPTNNMIVSRSTYGQHDHAQARHGLPTDLTSFSFFSAKKAPQSIRRCARHCTSEKSTPHSIRVTTVEQTFVAARAASSIAESSGGKACLSWDMSIQELFELQDLQSMVVVENVVRNHSQVDRAVKNRLLIGRR